MKTPLTPLISITTIVLWSLMMFTNNALAAELTINVDNIDTKRSGNILVMLFSSRGFPKRHDQALAIQSSKANASQLTFHFDTVEGELAVKILHDENGDGKVGKNWTGIYPAEGLGFSNGQRVGFTGPPKYHKSKVSPAQFREGLTISIIYP